MQRSTASSFPTDAHMILEHLPLGVALFEGDSWRLLAANAAFESLLDPAFQQGRSVGHYLAEMLPQTEASDIIALFHQIVEDGIASKQERSIFPATLAAHDTSWTWTLSPICDQLGKITQVLLMMNPMSSQIVERQQAEREQQKVIAAVKNSIQQPPGGEQKVQVALATLHASLKPCLLAVYTPSAVGQACQLLAAHPSSQPEPPFRLFKQDAFGQPSFLLKACLQRAPFITHVPSSCLNHQNKEDAFWLRLPGAHTLLCVPLWSQEQWEGVLVAALSDRLELTDTPIQTLLGCGTLLTEVLERSRFSTALAEARQRVFMILEHLPEGIVLVEATTSTISYANATAAYLLGRALPDLLGCPLNQSAQVHASPSFSPQKLLEWNFALIHALSGETITSQEYMVTRPDGSTAIVLCSAAPLRTLEGQIREAVLVFQDMTAKISLERQKNEFFAIANHELRTPLTAILGYAELLHLQVSSTPGPFQQEAIGHILQEGEHLRRLIQDLFDVSSLDYTQLKLKMEAYDLLDLVTQQISAAAQRTKTHHIALRLHGVSPGERLIGLGDPLRISQIVNNLLSNALKYSPAGTDVEVEIQPFRDTEGTLHEVQMSIRDQGIGIEAADLPHIFERFYRAASLDAGTSGFGVGLYLTRALVDSHGGQIWVKSKKGEGSTFCVVLPLHAGS